VTTDIGGNREILTNEENALLVPFGDSESFVAAVNRVLNDPVLGERLSGMASTNLEHFAWNRLIDETMQILANVTRFNGHPTA
jgi:glycosyltransferase involved in cell wall biosynthesis